MKALVPSETALGRIVDTINKLIVGRSNAAGSVTLTADATTTTVTSLSISRESFPQLTPASADAAGEFGDGTIYVSAVSQGSFVITHASSTSESRVVHWNAVGG